jgi:catechol 2,3-dioxygenase-like lactoylglutathione lyase family enzyme
MLERVDRMQLAVRDRAEATDTFASALGAEKVSEDAVRSLGAKRTTVRAGAAEFELLEPSGDGPVAEHLSRWPEGIFAGGFASRDVPAVAKRLVEKGIAFEEEGGQLFIGAKETRGMRMVISPLKETSGPGLITHLYEVTNIVSDHEAASSFYADAFGLDASRFCPINSDHWGYVGTLTLFDPPGHLDRIEITQTTQPLAMGRFFERRRPRRRRRQHVYPSHRPLRDADGNQPDEPRLDVVGAPRTGEGRPLTPRSSTATAQNKGELKAWLAAVMVMSLLRRRLRAFTELLAQYQPKSLHLYIPPPRTMGLGVGLLNLNNRFYWSRGNTGRPQLQTRRA